MAPGAPVIKSSPSKRDRRQVPLLIVRANRSTEDDVGLTRALEEGCPQSLWVTYEGDSNVSNAIRYFACDVGARILCVPRCRWADSPSVDIRSDFFGSALLQAS
jgi:hypothetical protein